MSRKSFSINSDFYEEVRNISVEHRGDLFLALVNWAMDEPLPSLDPACAILFRLMVAQIDRISKINSSNGKHGGAPVGNKNAAKTSETSEGKKIKRNKPSVTVTVTDSVSTLSPTPPSRNKRKITPSLDYPQHAFDPGAIKHLYINLDEA